MNSLQYEKTSDSCGGRNIENVFMCNGKGSKIKTEDEASLSESEVFAEGDIDATDLTGYSKTHFYNLFGQRFCESSSLDAHTQSIHLAKKSYFCDACVIGFSLKDDFEILNTRSVKSFEYNCEYLIQHFSVMNTIFCFAIEYISNIQIQGKY